MAKMFLRPATNPSEAVQRQRLLLRVVALREDIEIDFNTVAYWNRFVRQPHQPLIDPDPTGELRQWCHDVDELLKAEAH